MTLLEVEIAVVLLALIVLVMMGALAAQQRHATRTEEAARLCGVVRVEPRRVVITRLESTRTPRSCHVRPAALDVTQGSPLVRVEVSAP